MIKEVNVYDLDLKHARESDHNNNLSCKNQPKWDAKDPKQSIMNICNYFKSHHGRYCPHMKHGTKLIKTRH